MIKNIVCKTIIFSVLALVFSCDQDPIFYTISKETKPLKPRIQGGPTNMVEFNSRMYVASGKLFSYNSAGWDDSSQPGGKVIGLAAASNHLYALCVIGSGVTTVLRRKGPTGGWTDIGINDSKYTLVQSIYADNGQLFAGARNNAGSDYGILYLDGGVLRLIASDTEMLSGAASRDEGSGNVYFLSTGGRGVYKISETDLSANSPATQLAGSENKTLMGMLKLKYASGKEAIIVIERDGGTFFEAREIGFSPLTYSNGATVASGKYATGALALWQQVTTNDDGTLNYDGKRMLIAGIQGSLFSTTTSSSYTHGYVEIDLDWPLEFSDGGWLVLNSTRSISPDITVNGKTDLYTATIGKHPINHMYQVSKAVDANMIFFASTQTAGLWSYRSRDGELQWNAEGENEP